MPYIVRHALLVLSLTAVAPLAAPGESRAGGHDCCCHVCQQPCGQCCCGTASRPVWRTRDVMATEYRTEQTFETVPVTVTENVTVDEGSYQTVWVPRITTKPVARTVYQTRAACRTVPYQVTHRVSECTTHDGFSQAGRSVPGFGAAIGSFTTPGYARANLPPLYSGGAIASGSYPTPVASRIAPAPSAGSSIISNPPGRVPDARFAEAPLTPITPRSASIVPRSGAGEGRIAERSSAFVPAPSAAQVWRSTVVR